MLAMCDYQPPLWLKNPHLQTILASSKIRLIGGNRMRQVARETIIHTDAGTKLLGYHSRQKRGASKGLVVLLSGWEGSADSTYILRCAKILYQNGYDIFRLNYRDHGRSHHLNTGIFYAILLDEVYQAVFQMAADAGDTPSFLVGFSLGGNFVLRLLRKCIQFPIANLQHAVSISPVLNPLKSTEIIDRIAFIRKYFLVKWRRSLMIKQSLFPELYDFSEVTRLKTIREVTDFLLDKYSDFECAQDYFNAYAVMGSALSEVNIPATIITAADDPIIPISDFYDLVTNDRLQMIIHSHGGHNGFITGFKLQSWYEMQLVTLFDCVVRRL
ncbi:MAG: alpha/beta hydrolase [Desulfobacterales bacterium]|nr:alpha/beta hydrolase [Desulfobacterales bacterium]